MDIKSLLTDPESAAGGSTIDKPNSSSSTRTQNSSLVSPNATQALTTSIPDYPESMQGAPSFQGRSDLSFPSHSFSAGMPGPAIAQQDPPQSSVSRLQVLKRKAPQILTPEESRTKKLTKWTPEEDNLMIQLRNLNKKWDDIAERLPGRSSVSCRLRYQNYLKIEKEKIWKDADKEKLAGIYARYVQHHVEFLDSRLHPCAGYNILEH
jgi:hypothetical protein